jgi:hypothetical protein
MPGALQKAVEAFLIVPCLLYSLRGLPHWRLASPSMKSASGGPNRTVSCATTSGPLSSEADGEGRARQFLDRTVDTHRDRVG